MRVETQSALRALVKADPPATKKEQSEMLEALGIVQTAPTTARLLRPRQVMERLAISRRTLTNYGRRGLLRAVVPHGNKRALGYSEADVIAFIAPGSPAGKGGAG